MIRSKINIDSSTFICDLYKYGDQQSISKKFVMLRNVDILDKDEIDTNEIFLIDYDIINDTLYPIKDVYNQFSTDKNDFLGNSKLEFYDFYDQDLNDALLKCDLLKIYHPENRKYNDDLIIHITSNLGNTTVHLFCNNYNKCNISSSKQFIINNSYYTEYIEIYIPNIEQLMMNTLYYKEDFSKVSVKDNEGLIKIVDNIQYCYTSLFGMTYSMENGEKVYYKDSINNFEYNILVMLCPTYQTNNIFTLSDNILPGNTIFQDMNKISIIGKFDFRNSDDKLVLKCIFEYPSKFDSLQFAYEFINNVNLSDYENIYYDEDDYNYDETKSHKMYQCVYQYQLSTDPEFKNIIYTSKPIENITLLNTVKNVEFEIDPMFDSFDKLPEILVARIIFIDRYIGSGMFSNSIVINQDIYKYFTVKNSEFSLDLMDMENKFNFIKTIKCNIIKNTSNEGQIINTPVQNNKIIYKPVFYKVSDLQNINIYSGQTQNIGINLNQFMTKVETFVILIDNIKIIESGRNEMFVIFSIPANQLSSTSGTYHILNQDDEYISSGSWTII